MEVVLTNGNAYYIRSLKVNDKLYKIENSYAYKGVKYYLYKAYFRIDEWDYYKYYYIECYDCGKIYRWKNMYDLNGNGNC